MRISDWSSDVCSSDLAHLALFDRDDVYNSTSLDGDVATHTANRTATPAATKRFRTNLETVIARYGPDKVSALPTLDPLAPPDIDALIDSYAALGLDSRSEEPTSELQTLVRISYAVFCLKKKKNTIYTTTEYIHTDNYT